MIITLIFKLGAAPLHNWAPDLYANIPTPLTLYMATLAKFGILSFIVSIGPLITEDYLKDVWLLSGILSIIIGSLGLASQWRILRFLAYSAISHIGFLLLTIGDRKSVV